MKKFRYQLGHLACTTMTVAELKTALAKYPDTMPVLAEWEGVHAPIEPENLQLKEFHCGDTRDMEQCLIIDVNDY